MSQESENSKTVVYGNIYDPFFADLLAVIKRHSTRSSRKGSPVYPDHYRKLFIGVLCRCPYIKVEAIFAERFQRSHEFLCPHHKRIRRALHCRRRINIAFADTFPFQRRLRGFPPEISDRRCSKRNSHKYLYRAIFTGLSGNQTRFDLYLLKINLLPCCLAA